MMDMAHIVGQRLPVGSRIPVNTEVKRFAKGSTPHRQNRSTRMSTIAGRTNKSDR